MSLAVAVYTVMLVGLPVGNGKSPSEWKSRVVYQVCPSCKSATLQVHSEWGAGYGACASNVFSQPNNKLK